MCISSLIKHILEYYYYCCLLCCYERILLECHKVQIITKTLYKLIGVGLRERKVCSVACHVGICRGPKDGAARPMWSFYSLPNVIGVHRGPKIGERWSPAP